VFTNTVTLGQRAVSFHETGMGPHTTGVVRIDNTGPPYTAVLTATGSHDSNTANMTGTISVVRPGLSQGFYRKDGAVIANF
jgi:hypothetical protein